MNNKAQLRTYSSPVSAVFRLTKAAFGGLSNMAGGFPLRVNGTKIWSSEALYQACRFPLRPDIQAVVLAERSPMTAKMRSKRYLEFTRPDWDNVKVKIMRWCLRVKLAQNWDQFGRLLLSTDQKPIVENSRRDDFWGAKPLDDGTLIGMNVLGRLLMELRQELTSADSQSLRSVPAPDIPYFLLLGQPICRIEAYSKPGEQPQHYREVPGVLPLVVSPYPSEKKASGLSRPPDVQLAQGRTNRTGVMQRTKATTQVRVFSVGLPELEFHRIERLATSRGITIQEAVREAMQAWASQPQQAVHFPLDPLQGSVADVNIEKLIREEREAEVTKSRRLLDNPKLK